MTVTLTSSTRYRAIPLINCLYFVAFTECSLAVRQLFQLAMPCAAIMKLKRDRNREMFILLRPEEFVGSSAEHGFLVALNIPPDHLPSSIRIFFDKIKSVIKIWIQNRTWNSTNPMGCGLPQMFCFLIILVIPHVMSHFEGWIRTW